MEKDLFLNQVLQETINKLAAEMFEPDTYKPKFIVSIGCDKPRKQNPDLYCTCIHRDAAVTRLIDFNRYRGEFYTPFNLGEFIELLYNCTM